MRLYLSSMGGSHSIIFWLSVLGLLMFNEMLAVLQTYWLGYWAQQYEVREPGEVSVS